MRKTNNTKKDREEGGNPPTNNSNQKDHNLSFQSLSKCRDIKFLSKQKIPDVMIEENREGLLGKCKDTSDSSQMSK